MSNIYICLLRFERSMITNCEPLPNIWTSQAPNIAGDSLSPAQVIRPNREEDIYINTSPFHTLKLFDWPIPVRRRLEFNVNIVSTGYDGVFFHHKSCW